MNLQNECTERQHRRSIHSFKTVLTRLSLPHYTCHLDLDGEHRGQNRTMCIRNPPHALNYLKYTCIKRRTLFFWQLTAAVRGRPAGLVVLLTSGKSPASLLHQDFTWSWQVSESSGAVWESRWPSWAPRPNEPYGFCGRKATVNHA